MGIELVQGMSLGPMRVIGKQLFRTPLLVLAIGALLACGSPPGLPGVAALQLSSDRAMAAHQWIAADGRPSASAREALILLAGASSHGLDPAHYAAGQLQALAEVIDGAPESSGHLAAAFDSLLQTEFLRYLRHVNTGRVDPRLLGHRLPPPEAPLDLEARLETAATTGTLRALVAELSPPRLEYRALQGALERYRRLASDPEVAVVPPLSPTIHPGDRAAGLPIVYRLLAVLGDLPEDASVPQANQVYEEPLVSAVKTFQSRHGLDPDGVIGRATQSAMRVPLAWRVRQIELAMERLRWFPDPMEGRTLILNIPMFEVQAWNAGAGFGAPAMRMRAIVGTKATPTPVLTSWMRMVILRPFWNVPASILRGEILPAMAREPDYLARHQMEIVRGPGDDAEVVTPTPERVAELGQGLLRVRQRPGPHNALGLVKFHFENEESVYLHGTPAQRLFAEARRAFSHGCVRVEDPIALAEWVLQETAGWTRQRLIEATNGSRTLQLELEAPVQVTLVYITSSVTEDGVVRFADDLYGHDAVLDRLLEHQGQALTGDRAWPR